MTAEEVIAALKLEPHPEGGHYRETWRASERVDGRSTGTAILYLLDAHEHSRWHRVDADEIWHWHAGAPLELSIAADRSRPVTQLLGNDISQGQIPQAIVPAHAWQSARPLGGWVLAGCTVSPGFQFSGFEMAPDGWEPES